MDAQKQSFKEVFRRVRTVIIERYKVPVEICDVKDPNTGAFDGARIEIDFACDMEMSLFVLIHLFGHTVQWNTNEVYRYIDQRVKPGCDSGIIAEAKEYECQASRYGIALLHESGFNHLDQWVSDWWASDWKYLSYFYSSGKLGEWKSFRSAGNDKLLPFKIPNFTPQKYCVRYAF